MQALMPPECSPVWGSPWDSFKGTQSPPWPLLSNQESWAPISALTTIFPLLSPHTLRSSKVPSFNTNNTLSDPSSISGCCVMLDDDSFNLSETGSYHTLMLMAGTPDVVMEKEGNAL